MLDSLQPTINQAEESFPDQSFATSVYMVYVGGSLTKNEMFQFFNILSLEILMHYVSFCFSLPLL